MTWSNAQTIPAEFITIKALGENKIIASGPDDLYVSYNGGDGWERYMLDGYNQINAFSFYDQNNGIAVGENGYAIKTSTRRRT